MKHFPSPAVALLTLAACARTGVESDELLDYGPVADQNRSIAGGPTPKADCGIEVTLEQELLITDVSVVEDPVRTVWTGDDTEGASDGAWSFGKLMTHMAGEEDPSTFVQKWLELWTEDTILNGQNLTARPGMTRFLSQWPRNDDDSLDLTQSPMRLLAIVNRLDLASERTAGEGRLVFGAVDLAARPEDDDGDTGTPAVTDDAMKFTINLEFVLPLEIFTVEEWAALWHDLSTYTMGTEEYNTALQTVTDAFTGPAARPFQTNGSAISQIRTNEQALGKGRWQLREFQLLSTGFLKNQLLSFTPANRLNDTDALKHYINENADDILTGSYTIPLRYEDAPFRGAAVSNIKGIWRVTGPTNAEAMHAFSLNTCDGCHGGEAGSFFLHIAPRLVGEESELSPFLTGTSVIDPRDRVTVREFNELDKRASAMEATLCGE